MADLIKVLIADDEPALRRAWTKLFAMQSDMELVDTLASADQLVEVIASRSPDVVLLDLTMPGRDPLEEIRRASREHPSSRAIVYSGLSDPGTLRAALDAGAWGYIDKLADPSSVFEAVRRVAGGEVVFPPDLPVSSD